MLAFAGAFIWPAAYGGCLRKSNNTASARLAFWGGLGACSGSFVTFEEFRPLKIKNER